MMVNVTSVFCAVAVKGVVKGTGPALRRIRIGHVTKQRGRVTSRQQRLLLVWNPSPKGADPSLLASIDTTSVNHPR